MLCFKLISTFLVFNVCCFQRLQLDWTEIRDTTVLSFTGCNCLVHSCFLASPCCASLSPAFIPVMVQLEFFVTLRSTVCLYYYPAMIKPTVKGCWLDWRPSRLVKEPHDTECGSAFTDLEKYT